MESPVMKSGDNAVLDGVYNINKWIEANKASFQPPICNKLMSGGQLKIMFVGGPNSRQDYHIEEGEEFFYMLQGDMCLKIMEKGRPKDILISEGEVFVLPSRIPHSPQRKENTIGLVIERERLEHETDGLRYYCDDKVTVLFEEWFHCFNLEKDLPPVVKKYVESEQYKTGKQIPGSITDKPPVEIDAVTEVDRPFKLKEWLNESKESIKSAGKKELFSKGEFKITAYGSGELEHQNEGETWIWQLTGESLVTIKDESKSLKQSDVVIIPSQSKFSVNCAENSTYVTVNANRVKAMNS